MDNPFKKKREKCPDPKLERECTGCKDDGPHLPCSKQHRHFYCDRT
jgi:hypothetical protein